VGERLAQPRARRRQRGLQPAERRGPVGAPGGRRAPAPRERRAGLLGEGKGASAWRSAPAPMRCAARYADLSGTTCGASRRGRSKECPRAG